MTGYNGLNNLKVDIAKAGICKECGRRFTDKNCAHATDEQIAYTLELDAAVEAEYENKSWNRALSVIGYEKLNTEKEADNLSLMVTVGDSPMPDPDLPFSEVLTDSERRNADMELWAQEWQDTYRTILP